MSDRPHPVASFDESPSAHTARGPSSIHNARGKYFLLFGILFLILAMVNLDIENRADFGMARIERLRNGSNFFSTAKLSDTAPSQFARDLDVTQDELQTTDRVIDKFMEKLDQRGSDYWSRLTFFEIGDYRFYFGANLFVNFLFAFFISTGYYIRERLVIAEDLIDYQQRRYQRD
ncbi:MAG: hypothetical protein ABI579_07680, partial [Candidatus Sumerlaeota bacterium]